MRQSNAQCDLRFWSLLSNSPFPSSVCDVPESWTACFGVFGGTILTAAREIYFPQNLILPQSFPLKRKNSCEKVWWLAKQKATDVAMEATSCA